jgi:hypothetical protein
MERVGCRSGRNRGFYQHLLTTREFPYRRTLTAAVIIELGQCAAIATEPQTVPDGHETSNPPHRINLDERLPGEACE